MFLKHSISISQYTHFLEFVAIHYALSHREDTEYWREVSNKDWNPIDPIYRVHVEEQGPAAVDCLQIMKTALRSGTSWSHPHSGMPYIATGLNWFPLTKMDYYLGNPGGDDEKDIKESANDKFWKTFADRKRYWENIAEKCPSHYEYLKKNIYHE